MSEQSTGPGEFFDGVDDEAGREVMERARQRIEQVRKGSATVRLLDEGGQPVRGQAEIKLTRHAFLFGAATSHAHDLKPGERAYAGKAAALEVAAELLNLATVNCHWGEIQARRDGPVDWSRSDHYLAWAEQHGLRTRLHALLYINRSYTPLWRDEITSTDAWWPLIERRFAAIGERYGERIPEYDVINEMFITKEWRQANCPLFPALDDPQVAARIFALARKYLPKGTLIPLESYLLTTFPGNTRHREYYEYCRRLIDLGAPLDAIGWQGHHYTDRPSFCDGEKVGGPDAFRMKAIDEGLDHLASLGKPIHITEFNPPSRNLQRPDWPARLSDEAVAAWTVNFYTLAFSKPYIREINRWFIMDTVGGRGIDAGLVTLDGQKKPSYFALKKLLQETWSTRWTGALQNGQGSLRGFYGDYEVNVDGYRPATFQLAEGDSQIFEIRPKK